MTTLKLSFPNEGIALVTLAHPPMNAMDAGLLEELSALFEGLAADPSVRAAVIAADGPAFSAGLNLKTVPSLDRLGQRRLVDALNKGFGTLYGWPKPLVAAVNGHAIAGGAILAFACDHRLMSGGRIGVPELLVGVPFPAMALAIVQFAMPPQHLQPMIYFGRTIEAEAAKNIGIIDETPAAADLLERAHAIAQTLAAIPRDAFRLTKRQLREPYLRDAPHIAVASADEIDEIWASPKTHEHIRAYLAKTLKK